MKLRLAAAALALLFTLPAMSAAERQLVKTARIAAPVAEVWAAWTTAAGLKAFLGTDASIELRRGGKYEIYFGRPPPRPTAAARAAPC